MLPSFIRLVRRLWLLLLLPSVPLVAWSQPLSQPRFVAGDTNRVYTRAERMPGLPDGDGLYALPTLVQRKLVLPAEVREGRLEGQVLVGFTVGASGVVRDAKAVKSLSAATDAAACRAVAATRFRPATQNGQAVAVSHTVAVDFFGPNHVYIRAPSEVAKTAVPDLEAYFEQHMQLPASVVAGTRRRRVSVAFVVLPDGRPDAARLVSTPLLHDCPACDAEALRLVRGLPRYQPARNERGEPVAVVQEVGMYMPPARSDSTGVVYTYVEQMPALAGGGGGYAAIAAEVQRNVLVPPDLPVGTNRVFVRFVIGPSGFVIPNSIRVERPGRYPSADAAAVAAVGRLPRLQGGRQNGRPVSVSLTLPVVLTKP